MSESNCNAQFIDYKNTGYFSKIAVDSSDKERTYSWKRGLNNLCDDQRMKILKGKRQNKSKGNFKIPTPPKTPK